MPADFFQAQEKAVWAQGTGVNLIEIIFFIGFNYTNTT